jgi:hypothetical protein
MTQEKSSNEVLSEQLSEFFLEENAVIKEIEEVSEEVEAKQITEPKKAVAPNPLFEDMEEGEESDEEESEDEEQDPEVEERKELDRRLSGQPKEFKDLVKSVQDKELQTKILDAGKIVRAREDRLSLELGNLKKEYGSTRELIQFIDKDPLAALKHIAKVTNIDLSTLIDKPVQDEYDYDYRTPEEIKRDKELEDIKKELQNLKGQKSQDELSTIEQEVNSFADSLNEEGELKYPHFEKLQSEIFDILGLEKQRLGVPKTAAERQQRLLKAYQKAIMLDDELVAERDAELLNRAKAKRATEIEKAKKLKKFGSRSPSAGVKPASSKDALSSIYDNWASGNL